MTFNTPFKDRLFTAGIVLLGFSFLLFCLPLFTSTARDSYMAFFFMHFALAVAYLVTLSVNRRAKQPQHKRQYTFLLLLLLLISAYALNREMVIFATSPVWFCVLLVVLGANYIATAFFENLPLWGRASILFLLGVSIAVFTYLSIYLVPIYGCSVLGLLAMGISIHTFVPAFFLIYTFPLTRTLAGSSRTYWSFFWSGTAAIVVTVAVYSAVWHSNLKTINNAYTSALADGVDDLPTWMQVAQRIDDNATTEKILKTNLVYVQPRWNENLFWKLPERSFGEAQQVHDPLVALATLFSNDLYISTDEKLNILKSMFGGRHQTEERLWTGIDLRTQNVITTVQLWPENRLAYTEKTLTVFNKSMQRWQGNGQEAIYTFHLPEGGVVTALSLWINGKEEKGILTTKEKADTAYKAIVGVESRDPSVVHWKEGNTVSLRVFPVLANDKRIFKIGITAPLHKCGEQLVYHNIPFDGPDATTAEERVKVVVSKTINPQPQPASFTTDNGTTFTRSGSYKQDWHFSLPNEALSTNVFHFNGQNYFIKDYKPKTRPAHISDVYLDINSAWTDADFESVWDMVKTKNVWAYDNEDVIALTAKNRYGVFKKLVQNRFSFAPLFRIAEPETTLLISKSGTTAPNLSDLEGTPFLKKVKAFGNTRKKLMLFNIGDTLSPYLASLKEFRFFLYEDGDLKKLQQLMTASVYVSDAENEQEVVIHNAHMTIVKEAGNAASTAPDHLMRLFAYNHIMQQAGQQGFSNLPDTSDLVETAKEAYVVSPVSSLVVLETTADYERFGITDSKESLKNASAKSKGAVPEPHEWLLIIIGCTIAIYLFLKSQF